MEPCANLVLDDREPDFEACAAFGLVHEECVSAVGPSDVPDQSEPEPVSGQTTAKRVSRSKERLEGALSIPGIHARPVVVDVNDHLVTRELEPRDDQAAEDHHRHRGLDLVTCRVSASATHETRADRARRSR